MIYLVLEAVFFLFFFLLFLRHEEVQRFSLFLKTEKKMKKSVEVRSESEQQLCQCFPDKCCNGLLVCVLF